MCLNIIVDHIDMLCLSNTIFSPLTNMTSELCCKSIVQNYTNEVLKEAEMTSEIVL